MRQLIFSLLSLCRQDLFEVFFPGTVSNKLCPFQEVVCFMIYLLSWLWFFSKIVNIYQVYTWLFWYLHNSNTIGSNVVRLNLLFFQNRHILFLSSRSFYVMFIEFMFFDFTLSILLQEWYKYYCDMFSNHVFSLCQPETRCSWKGYHLKKYPPETGSSWKGYKLKNCPPEPGSSWTNTICKNVSLKYAPPWNGFCLWSCCAVKYYKSPET